MEYVFSTSLINDIMKLITNAENVDVLYEDNHVIAVNKRVGDIVQGDKTGDIPLSEIVKAYLKKKYNKPGEVFLGVVHRLDRPTTGVVLFVKTSKVLARLNAMFANKEEVQKTYWALVDAVPPAKKGTLTHLKRATPPPTCGCSSTGWTRPRAPAWPSRW